jgi:hypothetical protein
MGNYQVSFDKDADLELVEKQLAKLVEEWTEESGDNWVISTGFLPRKVIEAKGWSTAIHDMFDRVIPEGHILHVNQSFETLEECMANLEETRRIIANGTTRLYVLGTKLNPGVVAEINARASGSIFFPSV